MMGWQWHQLDHMKIIGTSLQTMPVPHHSLFTGQILFLPPSQQCQSTEGKAEYYHSISSSSSCSHSGGSGCDREGSSSGSCRQHCCRSSSP